MAEPRAAEEWARRCVSVALGVEVHHHDDSSAPSMYDLRVGPADAPDRIIEVGGAVDQEFTKTWNTGPGREAVLDVPEVAGKWTVSVVPGARIRDLKRALPTLLTEVAARGRDAVNDVDALQYSDPALHALLTQHGVDHLFRSTDDGPGTVYLNVSGGVGGAIDSSGAALPAWISQFLASPDRADNLSKLDRRSVPHREVFVIVGHEGAPWSVASYLTSISRAQHPLPQDPPQLPAPLTGVWIVPSYWFGDPLGVHWDGAWSFFRCGGPGISDDAG